ncbi:hypothetical protein ABZ892_09980 [Streptomyces sp. NPDC046924]|uniref:hypothetical protein n=1 Tax=Streptomyces sp. NPDC046924 TaxID=3155136 RepID=UPI00340097EC
MHHDLMDPLVEGDPQPLRNWLVQQGVNAEELRELPRWNASTPPPRIPAARRSDGSGGRVAAAVGRALSLVGDEPGGAALLLVYVMHEVDTAWEISYHFGPLRDTLQGACEAAAPHSAPEGGPDAAAVRAVLAAMECLDAEILAENHLATGQLQSMAEAMERAAARVHDAAGWAAEFSADFPALGAYLSDFCREREVNCRAVVTAVGGVVRFFEEGTSLDRVTRALAEAEKSEALKHGSCRSELRAHRFSLESLNAKRHDNWLRIDHGRLVYVYPFAVRGCGAEELVEAVRNEAAHWTLGRVSLTAAAVHGSLDLDNFWDGSDSLNRRYEGAFIDLPDVVLGPLDGLPGIELGRVGAQVIFSELGNHYVRFETELINASPSELHWMMSCAAPEYGALRVSFEEAPTGSGRSGTVWSRLSELAVQLAEDVGSELRRQSGFGGARVVARSGLFQVLVGVNAASVASGPGRDGPWSEVRRPAELMDAVGFQVLGHEIESSVGSLVEWIRYLVDPDTRSSVGSTDGEALVRTANTVVSVSLGRADWVLSTWLTLAEFTVSLDALFAGWSDELARHYNRVKALQARTSHFVREQRLLDGELDAFSMELDVEKLQIHDFAVEVRSMISLIRSPSLVSSPAVAETLRNLLQKSEFQLRVDELSMKLDEVTRDQLAVMIEKLAVHRNGNQRAKLEVFLAVITAAGVAGLVQVLQAGFGAGPTALAWAVFSVAAIVMGACLFGFWTMRSGRRRG